MFADRLDAGVVKVNEPTPGLEPHLPVGGWKASGYGPPELGPSALDFFTRDKSVYLNPSGAHA
jgi:aldehyde dehydrogenase (NAD+)